MNNVLHTVLVLILAGTTWTVQAQDDDDKEKWNGLRAGYYSSTLDGDWGEADARTGFYAGYFRNFIKVPLYSLSTGLEYHTSGATSGPAEARLGYLSLPINNRFKFGPVYFDIGVDPAFKLSEKAFLNGTEIELPDESKAESFDFLVHGGAGFKLLFLGVEVRYRRGLTEVYEDTYNAGIELGLSTFF